MRWGSSDVQAITSFLDIVQRQKGEKWVWAWMRKGVTASETGEEKKRVHCGFTVVQKNKP